MICTPTSRCLLSSPLYSPPCSHKGLPSIPGTGQGHPSRRAFIACYGLHHVPAKFVCWKSQCPVPQNVTFYVKKRSFQTFQVQMSSGGQTLSRYDWCPCKRVKFRHRHVKRQAEMYQLWDAKDGQETTRSCGGGTEHILSQLSEEANSANALSSDFRPPGMGDHSFLFLKPPSLWESRRTPEANSFRGRCKLCPGRLHTVHTDFSIQATTSTFLHACTSSTIIFSTACAASRCWPCHSLLNLPLLMETHITLCTFCHYGGHHHGRSLAEDMFRRRRGSWCAHLRC